MRFALLLLMAALPSLTHAQVSQGFYPTGLARYDFARNEQIADMAVEPDGRVVVAAWGGSTLGSAVEFEILRLNHDGTTDFWIRTNFEQEGSYADVLVLQKDGKILVAGRNYGDPSSNDGLALARLNSDGDFDLSFGNDGHVITALDGVFEVTAMLVQDDGTVLVAGYFDGPDQRYVLRYSASGDLDESYGDNGLMEADQAFLISLGLEQERPRATSDTIVQPDGKILTKGNSNGDFQIERFNSDGTIDASFGNSGRVRVGFPQPTYRGDWDGAPPLDGPPDYSADFSAFVLQPDGGIFVGGQVGAFPSDLGFFRLNADGTLDRGGACSDPRTAPSYAGGYEVDDYDALIKVVTPTGGARFEFYNTRNLYVGAPGTYVYGGSGRDAFPGQMSEQGNAFTFVPGVTLPGELYFPIYALDPESTNRVSFFLRVTDGCGRTVDVDPSFALTRKDEHHAPVFALEQGYPNPARDHSNISFTLEQAGETRLILYDLLGREVAALAEGRLEAGEHSVAVDATGLPSGVYIYRLTSNGRTLTQTLTVTH